MYNVSGMRRISRGFTLIELLVSIAVIAIVSAAVLAAMGPSSRQFARDAERKAELEQLRGALELYRNSNISYVSGSGNISTALSSLAPSYIQSLPTDPTSGRNYYYNRTAATTYVLCASLEKWTGPSPTAPPNCVSASCGTGCNYQLVQP